jgi:hypothetical protein
MPRRKKTIDEILAQPLEPKKGRVALLWGYHLFSVGRVPVGIPLVLPAAEQGPQVAHLIGTVLDVCFVNP